MTGSEGGADMPAEDGGTMWGKGQGPDPHARICRKATKGSHRQFRHPTKGMVVTVAGHLGKDVPAGTLKAILRSAGLERKED